MLQVLAGIAVSTAFARPAAPLLPIEVVAIPERPARADGGTEFCEQVRELPTDQRYAAGVQEVLRGNVPDGWRTWWPVVLEGAGHRVVAWVSPEYLAIGSDDDKLEFPLDLPSAARVALEWDCGLPTPKIVDAIYAQAKFRTEPQPLPPGPEMEGIDYLLQHRSMVARALGVLPDPGIVAGEKKDVVLTPRLVGRPGKEAIYGWHHLDGTPIQPLSLWHRSTYADYSHGIRLVFSEVWVDGAPMSLWDALADPVYGSILSDEGPIPEARDLLRRSIAHAEALAP